MNVCAKSNSKTVLDAFRKAYSFAEKANSAKRQVSQSVRSESLHSILHVVSLNEKRSREIFFTKL